MQKTEDGGDSSHATHSVRLGRFTPILTNVSPTKKVTEPDAASKEDAAQQFSNVTMPPISRNSKYESTTQPSHLQ